MAERIYYTDGYGTAPGYAAYPAQPYRAPATSGPVVVQPTPGGAALNFLGIVFLVLIIILLILFALSLGKKVKIKKGLKNVV